MKLQLDEKSITKIIESGGPEVALELRSAIVQSFANKHLKSVVNTEIFQEAVEKVKNIANDLLTAQIGKLEGNWHERYLSLTPEFKLKLDKAINLHLKSVLFKDIHERVNQAIEDYDVPAVVHKIMTQKMNGAVNAAINKRWIELVEATSEQLNDQLKQNSEKQLNSGPPKGGWQYSE